MTRHSRRASIRTRAAAESRLIIALDAPRLPEALRIANQLRGLVRYVKIGSILFTAEGPAAVTRLRALGFEVFLDLKFHDIPSTVEHSCRAAARHGVWMLTVHAAGGAPMLRAAREGAHREAARLRIRPPWIVAVTVLTSVGDGRRQLARRVVTLAADAARAGLYGVVASAHEVPAIRRGVKRRLVTVCPGIRVPGAPALDQRRTASPDEALALGADFLVVGRPVTRAPDPCAAVHQILADMEDISR